MARRYFYHLTDGTSLILDRKGHWTPSKGQIEPMAMSVAGDLMRGLPVPDVWSNWIVSVYDQKGSMVAVVPFPAGQE